MDKQRKSSKVRSVRLGDMFVDEHVQASFNPAWASTIAANFNVEGIGLPVLSLRSDGRYHIVDGQNRVAAMRQVGYPDNHRIACEVFEELTPAGEAEIFLERNSNRAKSPYDKYRLALEAGRQREIDTDLTVRAQGLHVSRSQDPGSVQAVNAILRIHDRMGDVILGKTLRIMRDSFGDVGFDRNILNGLSLVLERYGDDVTEAGLISALSKKRAGSRGLLQEAYLNKDRLGVVMVLAMADVIVDSYNRGKRGKARLESWWKDVD